MFFPSPPPQKDPVCLTLLQSTITLMQQVHTNAYVYIQCTHMYTVHTVGHTCTVHVGATVSTDPSARLITSFLWRLDVDSHGLQILTNSLQLCRSVETEEGTDRGYVHVYMYRHMWRRQSRRKIQGRDIPVLRPLITSCVFPIHSSTPSPPSIPASPPTPSVPVS